MGHQHGGPQEIASRRKRRIEAKRPGHLAAAHGPFKNRVPDVVDHGINRHARGHLTGIVAAHSVRHDAEAEVLVDRETVLVDGPDGALVGGSVCAQHRCSFRLQALEQ